MKKILIANREFISPHPAIPLGCGLLPREKFFFHCLRQPLPWGEVARRVSGAAGEGI